MDEGCNFDWRRYRKQNIIRSVINGPLSGNGNVCFSNLSLACRVCLPSLSAIIMRATILLVFLSRISRFFPKTFDAERYLFNKLIDNLVKIESVNKVLFYDKCNC